MKNLVRQLRVVCMTINPWGLVIGILTIAILYMGIVMYRLNQTNESLSTKVLEGNLQLGRAQTTIADASDKIKLLSEQIANEIKSHNAGIKMYTSLIAKYKSTTKGTLTVTKTEEKIVVITKDGKQEELVSLPFSYEDFHLRLSGDAVTKELTYTLMQTFELQLVETTKSNYYAELYELNPTGKRVGKLELTKFEVTVSPPEKTKAKLNLWNPRLDIGINLVLNNNLTPDITGVLGFTPSSYGVSEHDTTWRFLKLGIDVNKEWIGLSLAPAVYNVARNLPVLDNLWVGPLIGYKLTGPYYGLGISAAL